jgi:hypothetical protein
LTVKKEIIYARGNGLLASVSIILDRNNALLMLEGISLVRLEKQAQTFLYAWE